MRDRIIELATEPTTEEVLAVLAAVRDRTDSAGATVESILADLDASRG